MTIGAMRASLEALSVAAWADDARTHRLRQVVERFDGLYRIEARCAREGRAYRSDASVSTRSTAQTLTGRPAWHALEDHCQTIRNLHLRRNDYSCTGARGRRRPLQLPE